MTKLRIGTRGSALALWQARTVAAPIEARAARLEHRRHPDRRRSTAGGAALRGRRQAAVRQGNRGRAPRRRHRHRGAQRERHVRGAARRTRRSRAVLPREDPRDALVLRAASGREDFASTLCALEGDAVVGTGSVRCAAQLARRPATCPVCRHSRQRRYATAEARGRRLRRACPRGGRDAPARTRWPYRREIPLDVCVPAPGQGIIAVEMRTDDEVARRALARRRRSRDRSIVDR